MPNKIGWVDHESIFMIWFLVLFKKCQTLKIPRQNPREISWQFVFPRDDLAGFVRINEAVLCRWGIWIARKGEHRNCLGTCLCWIKWSWNYKNRRWWRPGAEDTSQSAKSTDSATTSISKRCDFKNATTCSPEILANIGDKTSNYCWSQLWEIKHEGNWQSTCCRLYGAAAKVSAEWGACETKWGFLPDGQQNGKKRTFMELQKVFQEVVSAKHSLNRQKLTRLKM